VNKNLFNIVLDQAYQLKDKTKITKSKKASDLKNDFDLILEDDALSDQSKKEELLLKIIDESVNTQSPRFLNQLYGGTGEVTWLAELIVAVLNTSMATYEIAPLFTLMEKELIKTINQKLNFKKYDGIMVPGGSYANMYGVHCARHFKDKSNKDIGLSGKKPYVAFVSKAAHYSTKKAMNLLGMGVDHLISVDTDANHKMCTKALKKSIENSLNDGFEPFCIVSTAGSTVWGSFDPIDEIQKISEEYKLWHHVDAAWGGLGLWSEKMSESYFKGIESVDSITLDFHKLMASSLTKAIFITSKPEVFYEASSGGGAAYIFHNQDDEENLDTGVYSIQCGRKVDSLSLWLQWKFSGTRQFRDKFSELHEIKKLCVSYLLKNSKDFKLLHEPEFMNICFHVLPKDGTPPDYSFNQRLRAKVMERGNFMVNFSKSESHGTFFRLVLNHWGVDEKLIMEFFKELLDARDEILN